jgi:hypothetical protein
MEGSLPPCDALQDYQDGVETLDMLILGGKYHEGRGVPGNLTHFLVGVAEDPPVRAPACTLMTPCLRLLVADGSGLSGLGLVQDPSQPYEPKRFLPTGFIKLGMRPADHRRTNELLRQKWRPWRHGEDLAHLPG